MASASLTQQGQACMLLGAATPNGGIANIAAHLKLYSTLSTPAKDGTGFVEVVNGNGYTAGGQAVSRANWTQNLDGPNERLTLALFTWLASGGNIPASGSAGIAGAYITDSAGVVLAWWPASQSFILSSGATAAAAALAIELN